MNNDHLTPRETLIGAGEPAPDFTLLDQDRNEWSLSAALSEGDVVLSFFPMAFTSVCETEMSCVRDEATQFREAGAHVVGISCDSFAVQKAWAEKEGFTHRLLADMHRQVCKAYGLYWPDLNVASRGTVVVTKHDDGAPIVKWSQGREVMNAMEPQEILAAVR